MYTFNFQKFINTLDIIAPNYDGIPLNSPIFIFYREAGNLTRHSILKKFHQLLKTNDVSYLSPYKVLTEEWIINLDTLKKEFDCLKQENYVKGQITIEPEYSQTTVYDEDFDEEKITETKIKFAITPSDIHLNNQFLTPISNGEIAIPLESFKKDNASYDSCGFLMMKFEDTRLQREIIKVIQHFFKEKNINIVRADEKWYSDDLFCNIKTYMHGCSFGIAMFDRVRTEDFNPNVSLEIGYMMASEKPVLLLKDSTLRSLQTDLVGKLYHQFDVQNPDITLPPVLEKWGKDKNFF